MKLNKTTLRNIISIVLVVLAVILFLQDHFAAPQSAEPAPPESGIVQTEEPDLQEELDPEPEQENPPEETEDQSDFSFEVMDENGSYTSKEDVADYIHTFDKLPNNFITKNEAKELGWESSEGNLWEVAPGMSIGGDRFGNYEGQLPEAEGRSWTECDIDYEGGYRGDKRIVFSNDGLIYYTDDHYESFTQIY